jgi:uncharacterized protein (DUF486 family)
VGVLIGVLKLDARLSSCREAAYLNHTLVWDGEDHAAPQLCVIPLYKHAEIGSFMSVLTRTVLLLIISNVFMLTAWYLHLKTLYHRPWYIASLVSWGIAFFEYTVHIPANRIGHLELTLSQLQVLQVGMSLLIFIPFAIFVMGQPVKLDYVWAALCLLGAAYFIFRGIV